MEHELNMNDFTLDKTCPVLILKARTSGTKKLKSLEFFM